MTGPANAARGRATATLVERVAASAAAKGPGRWRVSLGNGAPVKATLRLDEDWLCGEAAVRSRRARRTCGGADRLWRLLRTEGRLTGGAKYVWLPSADGGRVRARAEVPLLVGTDGTLERRLIDACAGLRAAVKPYRRKRGTGRAADPPDLFNGEADEEAHEVAADLPTLCSEAGWPFVERTGGRLAVELETGRGFYQAMVEAVDGTVRWGVELASLESPAPVCRRALGVLLLTANGLVRLARAAGRDDSGRVGVGFEVVLGRPVSAGEFGHALSALSVATQLCGREVQILRDSDLASTYLSVRGWSPDGSAKG